MKVIQYLVIFLALTYLTQATNGESQNLPFQRKKEPRQLQSCGPNCDICDLDGTCLQCSQLRVFPNCSCQIGYYEDQGTCKQCKPGCMSCTSANDCQSCYSIYVYNSATTNCDCNIPNAGAGCEDQQTGNLIQITRFNTDLRSYIVIFNQMISIKGVTLDQQYISQYTNCQAIIDPNSLLVYDNNVSGSSIPSCQIDPMSRNQFIIYLTTVPKNSYTLTQPNFILANMNVMINQKAIPVTQIYLKEPQVGIQHNRRTKVVYFSLTNYIYQYSASSQQVAKLYVIDVGLFDVITLNKVSIVSPTQYSNIQFTSQKDSNIGYNILFTSDPQINDTIQLSVQCTLPFGITYTDTVTVQLSSTLPSSPYSVYIPYVGNSFYSFNDAGFAINVVNFPQVQDYQVKFSFIPQVMSPQTIQCNSFTTYYQIIVPAYTVKYTTSIYLIIRVYDINGVVRGKGYIQYANFAFQYLGQASYNPIVLTKLNPTTNISINQDTSQFVLSQAKYFNPQYYIQTWFCLDSNGNVCVDSQNKPLKLTQNGSNLVQISSNSLPLNTQYTMYYQLMSQGYPFSKQYASYLIDTGTTNPFLIVQGVIPSLQQPVKVNLQDVIYVSMQLHTDFTYKIGYAQYTLTLNQNNVKHTIQQTSNQFSFILQDYYPTPDYTQPLVSVDLSYSIFDYYFNQNIPLPNGSNPSTVYLNTPPSIQLTIPSKTYIAFQDLVTITLTPTDSQKLYQFFYYDSLADLQFEIKNPLQPRRKMLSPQSAIQSISCLLPAGNIVVMGVYFDSSAYIYTNVTQTVQITNNNFNQQTLQTFVSSQMSQAQNFQNQKLLQSEIFVYQNVVGSVNQYEAANTSPSQINDQKTQILNRLISSDWTQQFDDNYNLSGQIIYQLISSQYQLDPKSQLFSQLQQSTTNRISQLNQALQQQSVSLSISQINFFKESLKTTANTYMQLVEVNSSQGAISSSDIVNQTNQIMNGFAYLLQPNQPAIDFPTSQGSLRIENNDNLNFYNNYYSQVIQNLDTLSSSNFNQYVTISTWSNSSFLYRDELSQYNQQYISQTNQTVQNLLNRTYPLKIPNIYTNNQATPQSSRRRFLQSQSVSVPSGFTLNFGAVAPEEKLKCIQRQTSGTWVHSSCQTTFEIVNNQRNIKCVCQTPQVTSVISDITQLLDNKNLQKIFSEDGIAGLASLTNWYEYAPIWTMVALNIGFAIMLYFAHLLDKADKSIFNQTTPVVVPEGNESNIQNGEKRNKTLFLKVKVKKASDYDLQNEIQLQTIQQLEKRKQQPEVDQLLQEKVISNNSENEEQNSMERNKIIKKEDKSLKIIQTKVLSVDQRSSSNQIINAQEEGNEQQNLAGQQQNQISKQDQLSEQNEDKKITLADENQLQKQKAKEGKEAAKKQQEQEKKSKDNLSRQKLIDYLNAEKPIYAIMTYHNLFQTFIIYQEDQSRLLRFIVYYNKVVWLLTLNSIFGQNLSVVQVIVLSIVSTIVLQIVTNIIQILFKYKKLRTIGLIVTTLFCLFCYYSILVVIAGQSAGDANMWIISYFATFILNEFIIGVGVCAAMYYACKKIILKAQNNTFLELLGASPLLQAFSS
ncbi:hypothetical protein ABPG74_002754 [Tetrahymena malaccensis]